MLMGFAIRLAVCAAQLAAALSPEWRISLNIGREADTRMPAAWGASADGPPTALHPIW